MKPVSKTKNNFIFVFAMAVLLLLQLLALFYYGGRKAGFHEDEIYTYYSSNKTAGLFVNDRQWLEGQTIKNEFVVLPGEGFRYNVVKQMQSWDVHPPLYYYLFHTACSLFPGIFSKWTGIGVNLIAYAISYLLLAYGAYCGAASEKEGRILAFLTCLAWGFCGAVISGVMFIRMYQWLTVFVLLCMDLHLRAVKKREFRAVTFYLPVCLTVFLGFLTQYYYIIFHFFLGAGFCVFLLKNKKIRELLFYMVSCGTGFLGAVCYYPASLSHIFRGYRGTEAVSEFGDISNTWERLRFFYGLFDDYVMNGTLSLWLLAICLLAVTTGYRKKKGEKFSPGASLCLLGFTCAGYFFTVSKTALILGETSNRYQLPVYGILLFLILYGMWTLAAGLVRKGVKTERILFAVFAAVILAMDAFALKSGKVFFLYEEEKEVMEFVEENRDETVAVFYNEASSDNIWRLSNELMEYEKVYLASQGNQEPIGDGEILESRRLLAYVADYEGQEECVYRLLETAPYLDSCRIVARKGLWTLYEMW